MSAFKELRDVSNYFENEIRELSSQLFTARIGEKFEEALAKKTRDKTLLSSKLKLLRAKPLALSPQIKEQSHDEALQEYGDAAVWKVLEGATVKSLTQSHAVKTLLTKHDKHLDPELIERKKAIIESLLEYSQKEHRLGHLNMLLKEREAEQASLRIEWDNTVGALRDIKDNSSDEKSNNRGPLYVKLSKIVDKLELMRWLVGQLVCPRSSYDWLADPHQRLSALALTRTHYTVDMFTED